jgi:CheY-like chemotaxis protein
MPESVAIRERGSIVTNSPAKQHILVINDTQEVLEVMRELLEDEGYKVTLYSTAIRDLHNIREIGPDLLILDHLMGDEEYGWQTIQKLRLDRELAALPVIVCTAAARMVEELEGHLEAKGITVVLKPFDIEDLLSAVRAAFGQKQLVD